MLVKYNVNYVPNDINPPNLPQPIENFWGCLAQKVYEGGWTTHTERQLMLFIKAKVKEFDETFLKTL